MPYPLLLAAGLAASAASAGMSMAANKESKDAMARARAESALKQQKYQQQANEVLQKSISQSGSDAAASDMAKGAEQRTAALQAIQRAGPTATGAAPAATTPENTIVQTDPTETAANTTAARGNAWNNVVSGAQAKLGSYGDWETGQAVKNARATSDMAVPISKARAEAALLPGALNVASQAGSELSGWGSLVGALGSVASMGGAMGYGNIGTAATAATPLSQVGNYPGTSAMLNNIYTTAAAGNRATNLSPWTSIVNNYKY